MLNEFTFVRRWKYFGRFCHCYRLVGWLSHQTLSCPSRVGGITVTFEHKQRWMQNIPKIIIIETNFLGNWVYGDLMSAKLLQNFCDCRTIVTQLTNIPKRIIYTVFFSLFLWCARSFSEKCWHFCEANSCAGLIKTLTFAPPIKINSIPLYRWVSDTNAMYLILLHHVYLQHF